MEKLTELELYVAFQISILPTLSQVLVVAIAFVTLPMFLEHNTAVKVCQLPPANLPTSGPASAMISILWRAHAKSAPGYAPTQ